MENININYKLLVKTISKLPKQAQRTFFLTACLNADLDLCRACLDAKFDMKIGDEYYGNPFFVEYVESSKAKEHVVDWLIANGLDINHHNDAHFSPLMAACANGNLKMVKCLLNKKAKFKSLEGRSNHDGEIYWALADSLKKKAQRFKIVKLLLEAGAPLNVDDAGTNNPLYMSIDYKYGAEFVKLFLQYGISANLVVGEVSLLTLAVIKDDFDTVKALLENGADVNYKVNGLGCAIYYRGAITPLDFAIHKGNERIQALLKEYGGVASTKQEKLNYLFNFKDKKAVVDIIEKLIKE